MMELAGYLASALIGISLGLIGGGGSILTVPVMVYLFQIPPLQATSYSLFIVGTTSLAGAINSFRKGEVSLRATAYFGLASVATVFATRKFLIPSIPAELAVIKGYIVTESIFTMVMFGLLMIVAALRMIKESPLAEPETECSDCMRVVRLLGYGLGIGLVTGLLGAGGGFLLIPALVLLVKLPMKQAIGTSLAIISMNSLIGFAGDLGHFNINWNLLLTVGTIAFGGLLLGQLISLKIRAASLRIVFGRFVLVMGIIILMKEIACVCTA